MKKMIYALFLLFVTCAFTSCEMFGDNCQVCQIVTYENGNPIKWESEAEYCGQQLITIKASAPVTINGITTRWECR